MEAEGVSKMVVLVTGGAGFIGSFVAEALLKRGDNVVIADNFDDYYDVELKRSNIQMLKNQWNKNRLKVYEGNLRDEGFVKQVFTSEPTIRRIVHLAGRSSVRNSIEKPVDYIRANLTATTRLLEMARLHGGIEHFVYASTSLVYGESYTISMSEDDMVERPLSPYGATKKMCELTAHTYHHLYGLNVTGLRIFMVYGPRCRPDMTPFKLIDRIYKGVRISKMKAYLGDYTYIDDIVDGVLLSLDQNNSGYSIYNLGSGVPLLLGDYVKAIEKAGNIEANADVDPDEHLREVDICYANIAKAKKELGYSPKVSLSEGIAKTLEWYQSYSASLPNTVEDYMYLPRPRSLSVSSSEADDEVVRKVEPAMLPRELSTEALRMVQSLHLSTTSYEQKLALKSATSPSQSNAIMNARSWAPGDLRPDEQRVALSDLFTPPSP